MSDVPPEPPALPGEQVSAIIDWLQAMADWLRRDQVVAAAHGHVASVESVTNLRLYEDAALLFRESYGRE